MRDLREAVDRFVVAWTAGAHPFEGAQDGGDRYVENVSPVRDQEGNAA